MKFNRGDRVRDVRVKPATWGTIDRVGEEVSEVKWDAEPGYPASSYVPNVHLKKEKD